MRNFNARRTYELGSGTVGSSRENRRKRVISTNAGLFRFTEPSIFSRERNQRPTRSAPALFPLFRTSVNAHGRYRRSGNRVKIAPVGDSRSTQNLDEETAIDIEIDI